MSSHFRLKQAERFPDTGASSERSTAGFLQQHCQSLVNTRKDDRICMARVEKPPQAVLVTSLGGSGTHVVSFELCKIGLDMPHERMGVDGSVVSRCAMASTDEQN